MDQYPGLKKKADIIIWYLLDENQISDSPAPVKVLLAGWSKMEEVLNASIKLTGLDNMRKVNNCQLAEADLHEMSGFLNAIS